MEIDRLENFNNMHSYRSKLSLFLFKCISWENISYLASLLDISFGCIFFALVPIPCIWFLFLSLLEILYEYRRHLHMIYYN